MKQYETVTKTNLMRRTPTIIRLDGKAFHTWTTQFDRPFDPRITTWMGLTMKYLVDNIQNAVFAYCQSDEISILLRDYDNIKSEQWYNGNIQKMVSVSASLATAQFNDLVRTEQPESSLALFDSRVFNIPVEEVTNYFIWRQQDAIRNSISSLAQETLGHKACQGLKSNTMIDVMKEKYDVDWNELDYHFRHGLSYVASSSEINVRLPKFTELRDFINIHVYQTNQ